MFCSFVAGCLLHHLLIRFHLLLFLPTMSRTRKNKGLTVPVEFAAFLKASLSKMAGQKFLDPQLISLDFWNKLPIKFSAVKFYEKSLVTFFKITTNQKFDLTFTCLDFQ